MALMKQTAALRKKDGAWKVVSFENSFGGMEAMSSR
jgi:hypothetical protein